MHSEFEKHALETLLYQLPVALIWAVLSVGAWGLLVGLGIGIFELVRVL